MADPGSPRWEADGRDWPGREHSRFVPAGELRWHVQVAGAGPVLLLLHGTGAATHSWRGLLPLLARRFTVVAPDLPGHGFTTLPARASGMSLPAVAGGVAALLRALGMRPRLLVGHSAGAAVAARLALDAQGDAQGDTAGDRPAGLVSLNGALRPFHGAGGVVFPAVARLLGAAPLVPWLASLQAGSRAGTERLLATTGSRIAAEDARRYARLLGRPGHVAGALRMMAHWDLRGLDLRRLALPVLLVAGARDGMVPPADAPAVARLLPDARVATLPGLGHLAHEEAPEQVAGLVLRFAEGLGLLPAVAA